MPASELSRGFSGSPSVNTAPIVDSLPMPAFARTTDSVRLVDAGDRVLVLANRQRAELEAARRGR